MNLCPWCGEEQAEGERHTNVHVCLRLLVTRLKGLEGKVTAKELLKDLLAELDQKSDAFGDMEAKYSEHGDQMRCHWKGQMCRDLERDWRRRYREMLGED